MAGSRRCAAVLDLRSTSEGGVGGGTVQPRIVLLRREHGVCHLPLIPAKRIDPICVVLVISSRLPVRFYSRAEFSHPCIRARR
jgi:hypothetical protein